MQRGGLERQIGLDCTAIKKQRFLKRTLLKVR